MFKLDDDDLFNFDDQEFHELITASSKLAEDTNKENARDLQGREQSSRCNTKESTLGLGIHSAVVKKTDLNDAPPPRDKPFNFTPQPRTPLYSPIHSVTVQRSSLDVLPHTPQRKRAFNEQPSATHSKVQRVDSSPVVKTVLSPFNLPAARADTPKRKFPGPAGLLPRLPSGSSLQSLRTKASSTELIPDAPAPILEQLASSQNPEELFQRSPWLQMKSDLDLQEDDPDGLLARFNIAWVLEQATLRQLPRGKVPVLCAAIKSISPTGTEAGVVLYDKTGQIHGALQRSLVEDYGSSLQPGAVLVIQQASVLSPSVRRHYLNLTPSNLVALYSEEGGFRTEGLMTGSQLLHQALTGLSEGDHRKPAPSTPAQGPLRKPQPPSTSQGPTVSAQDVDDLLEDDMDDIFRDVTEELPF